MKPNISTKIIGVATFFIIMFISCRKETSPRVTHNKSTDSMSEIAKNTVESSAAVINTPYYSCGMKINVFTPLPKLYSFGYTLNSQIKLIGLGDNGIVNFTNPDKFSFEFADYVDNSKTVKTWRIKRTDGKYLTAYTNNYLAYRDKLTGPQEVNQIFLLASLGNNLYKILLPKMPVCNVAVIYFDIDYQWYFTSSREYNSGRLSDQESKFIMLANTLSNN